jgi:hypothetical protein
MADEYTTVGIIGSLKITQGKSCEFTVTPTLEGSAPGPEGKRHIILLPPTPPATGLLKAETTASLKVQTKEMALVPILVDAYREATKLHLTVTDLKGNPLEATCDLVAIEYPARPTKS